MKLYPNLSVFLLMCLFVLSGCKSVEDHIRGVRDESGEKVTVGKVQAEIQTGMSGAQVAEVLGSPNIVTTDEEERFGFMINSKQKLSLHKVRQAVQY